VQTIYLNHAGTSWPKPPPVVAATGSTFHAEPARWPELFAAAHETAADFFHVEPSRLLLTPSCTAALQLAVQDHSWRPGDRVLTSHFEHHALQRSLVKLEDLGVVVTALPYSDEEPIPLDALEAELKRGSVRLLALTAACNVTGRLLPISEATALAHRFGALALIDGAQIAGWWDLDVAALEADLFTFAGHKGPQAPWGVGGLYVRPDLGMKCPAAVCDVAELQAGAVEGNGLANVTGADHGDRPRDDRATATGENGRSLQADPGRRDRRFGAVSRHPGDPGLFFESGVDPDRRPAIEQRPRVDDLCRNPARAGQSGAGADRAMLRKLLTIVLPLVLPLLVYAIYLALARRKARLAGEGRLPRWQEAPWAAILIASILLMITSLAVWRMNLGVDPGVKLVPPSVVDGEVVPSHPVPE